MEGSAVHVHELKVWEGGAVEIAIEHEALAECCIVNRGSIPGTISSCTAVSSVL